MLSCVVMLSRPRNEAVRALLRTTAVKQRQWPLRFEGFDWIGFDLDHTLIPYSHKATEHTYRAAVTHILKHATAPLTDLSAYGRVAQALAAVFGGSASGDTGSATPSHWPPSLAQILSRAASGVPVDEHSIPYWAQFATTGTRHTVVVIVCAF